MELTGAAQASRGQRLGIGVAVLLLLAALLPRLAHDLSRVGRATPIDYVEGWNAYHTARVFKGQRLYRPVQDLPLTPVNYPPLSFLLGAGLAHATGSVVVAGRLISLVALAAVTALQFLAVTLWTGSRASGLLAALVWLGLLTRFGGAYVGSNDPQMLGHALCALALCLLAAWQSDLTPGRVMALAVACSLALFVKHLLLAVPASLAIVLWQRQRRLFPAFALAGLACSGMFALVTWLAAGDALFANLNAFARPMDGQRMWDELGALFLDGRLGLVVAVVAGVAWLGGAGAPLVVVYLLTSLALGAAAVRGVGVDRNAWFDFFQAVALVLGLLAARTTWLRGAPRRAAPLVLVVTSVLPVASDFPAGWRESLNFARLAREEAAYLQDVALLRSLHGPALFEEPLLGFDAGKDLLFDPFAGSLAIVSGRVAESVLLDPIRRRDLAAIVLTSPIEALLPRSRAGAGPDGVPRLRGWWTQNALKAIQENYDPYDPGRRRYGYFYLPKSRSAGSSGTGGA